MKNAINLDKVLFHGLGNNEDEERTYHSLITLDAILKSGAILSRANQKKQLPKLNISVPLYQLPLKNRDDYVCVCKRKSSKYRLRHSEAFSFFVEEGISLILDSKILSELEIREQSFQDGEIQFKDKIPLNYVLGIGIKCTSDECLIKHEKKMQRKGKTRETAECDINYTHRTAEEVKNCLVKHGIDLPIYSIEDGKLISSVDVILNQVYDEDEQFI